ncbi:MAG TPA: DNA polymerase III subunit gamma/tau [Phycisphaerales bacterium]|nr:DNA polymerase III subunit gamma/tau [Phycisphaerales bacterium]
MAYTVLARRYRSQTFDDVVGQEPVAQTLKNAIRAGRVAHAYLFTGTRGVGKTTMARILAKALNCLRSEGPTAEPCLECDSCRAIHAGDDIDVIEIDGASNTGVDNIRQLRENALYRPARARFKIYIIDEVHMLSAGAFNALLKILEEPPDHVKFIFATTEPHKVLPTIQSRCQRFDFRSLQPAEIAGQLERILKAEQIAYEPDAVVHLARLANGSMRDALSLLDQLTSAAEPLGMDLVQSVLGQGGREELCVLLEHIAGRDGAAVLAAIDTLLKAGRTPAQLVEGLIDTLRDLMVLRCTDAGSDLLVLTDQERQRLSGLAEAFDTPALIYGITALERLRWTIRNSETARALLEASLLRLTLSEHFIGVDQLLSRLSGAPAAPTGVKKNAIAAPAGRSSRKPTPTSEATTAISGTAGGTDQRVAVGRIEAHVDSIREQWPAILAAFKQENPANGSFLTTAEPLAFEGGVLTLGYDPTAVFARNLCEARADAVAEQLSRIMGFALRLRVKGTAPASAPAAAPPRSAVTQQALDDPAVKTLLAGLDASVIQIEPVGPTP